MIIASMCTIPVRKSTFKQVAYRILRQQTLPVDQLHVWLNGYKAIDGDLPKDSRLIYHLEPSNPGPLVRYRSGCGGTWAANPRIMDPVETTARASGWLQRALGDLTQGAIRKLTRVASLLGVGGLGGGRVSAAGRRRVGRTSRRTGAWPPPRQAG